MTKTCEYEDGFDAQFYVEFSKNCCGLTEANLCPKCLLEALPRKQGDASDILTITFEGHEVNIDQARSLANQALEGEAFYE